MKGVFIENAFYKSKAVDQIYESLKKSADKRDIILDRKDNDYYIQRLDKITNDFDYDFCVFWNKDIILAKALEKSRVRVFNSAEAIEICDNKALTHLMLSDIVDMPKTLHIPFTYENTGYTHNDFLEMIGEELGYPYVIKECFGSLGSGVYLATNLESAKDILKKCDGIKLIAQEFVEPVKSDEYYDIRAYFVGKNLAAAMQRYSSKDFRVNVGIGGNVRNYELTDSEIDICQRIMSSLKLDFAGIDILHSVSGPLICEVNSNAQFVALNECSGKDVSAYIIDYIIERMNQ